MADASEAAAPATSTADLSLPLKRPPSSYFLFCAAHRAEVRAHVPGSVAAVAKALGERWKALPAEEKVGYEAKAKAAKAAYTASLQQQKASGALRPAPTPSSSDPLELCIPPSFVRRLLHLDPAIKRASKEAAHALSKSAEVFVGWLVAECWKVAVGRKRKRLCLDDLVTVAEGVGGVEWMRGEMRRMKRASDAQREREKKEKEERDAAAVALNPPEATADKENDAAEEKSEAGEKSEGTAPQVAGAKGKRARKAKGAIDPKQYQSLASMFSRQGAGAEQNRRRAAQADDDVGDVEEIVRDEETEAVEEEREADAAAEAGEDAVEAAQDDEALMESDGEVAVVRARGSQLKRRRRTVAADEDDNIEEAEEEM